MMNILNLVHVQICKTNIKKKKKKKKIIFAFKL